MMTEMTDEAYLGWDGGVRDQGSMSSCVFER